MWLVLHTVIDFYFLAVKITSTGSQRLSSIKSLAFTTSEAFLVCGFNLLLRLIRELSITQ